MILHNNIPLFPFDLERAKNGEPFYHIDWEDTYIFKSLRENMAGEHIEAYHSQTNRLAGIYEFEEYCYMLSPDPATIPTGAREKFESEAKFISSKIPALKFLKTYSAIVSFYEKHVIYANLLEIRDWGFCWQTETFGVKTTRWIEFKDITFID